MYLYTALATRSVPFIWRDRKRYVNSGKGLCSFNGQFISFCARGQNWGAAFGEAQCMTHNRWFFSTPAGSSTLPLYSFSLSLVVYFSQTYHRDHIFFLLLNKKCKLSLYLLTHSHQHNHMQIHRLGGATSKQVGCVSCLRKGITLSFSWQPDLSPSSETEIPKEEVEVHLRFEFQGICWK